MRTTNPLKIYHVLMVVFLVITSLSPSYAENNQQIPATFTEGTWIFMSSKKAEIDYCKNKEQHSFAFDDFISSVYSFDAKTNTFKIVYSEEKYYGKVLSFSKITPMTIKGTSEYTCTAYPDECAEIKEFDFTIKNNRLYSNSQFKESYNARAKKYGLYHCVEQY